MVLGMHYCPKRRVEATEMDDLWRSSRISRKERIRNVAIRQFGLEETSIKEIEQNIEVTVLPKVSHLSIRVTMIKIGLFIVVSISRFKVMLLSTMFITVSQQHDKT